MTGTGAFFAAEPGAAEAVAAAGAVQQNAWLLVALPALGALVLLTAGRRANGWGHLLGCATVIAAFAYGLLRFGSVLALPAAGRGRAPDLVCWIPGHALQVGLGVRRDRLTLVVGLRWVGG